MSRMDTAVDNCNLCESFAITSLQKFEHHLRRNHGVTSSSTHNRIIILQFLTDQEVDKLSIAINDRIAKFEEDHPDITKNDDDSRSEVELRRGLEKILDDDEIDGDGEMDCCYCYK